LVVPVVGAGAAALVVGRQKAVNQNQRNGDKEDEPVPTRLEALYARRAAVRRAEARPARHRRVGSAGRARGVDAGVIGSLARDRMRDYSDIDFLILDTGGLSWNELVKRSKRTPGHFRST
jgi:UTP:GlnB (protein PII) uridylyltransferase